MLAAVRRSVPGAHLCFVGEEDDIGLHEFGVLNTGYVAWLKSLAAQLDLTDAISFTGPVFGEALARLYAAADVAVSASVYHRENFGLAQAEAQACGVPVVCSAWDGFRDVLRDGETGYLIDAVLTKHGIRVDWATGAARVVALLRDRARRDAMGRRAAEWARERFSVATLGRALAEVAAQAAVAPVQAKRRSATGMPPSAGSTPAYEPSAFARRYEAHKRACGWYGDTPEARRAGSLGSPMFQGRDYRLYERLLQPFASSEAARLSAGDIAPDWVPYYASRVELDDPRHLIEDHDPIWPHRRFCRPSTWAVVRHVNGVATAGEIAAAVAAESPSAIASSVPATLRLLYIDGFLLFRRPGAA